MDNFHKSSGSLNKVLERMGPSTLYKPSLLARINSNIEKINPISRVARWSAQHAYAATKLLGDKGIVNNSFRFAGNIGFQKDFEVEKLHGFEGSLVNAFRHTLGQAAATVEIGEDIAKEAADYHESNPNADLNQTNFTNGLSKFSLPSEQVGYNLSDADQTIDLRNNIIGRKIGRDNPRLSMKELAFKVADHFYKIGLYTAMIHLDGSVSIDLTKLTSDQYIDCLSRLKTLDENGFMPSVSNPDTFRG